VWEDLKNCQFVQKRSMCKVLAKGVKYLHQDNRKVHYGSQELVNPHQPQTERWKVQTAFKDLLEKRVSSALSIQGNLGNYFLEFISHIQLLRHSEATVPVAQEGPGTALGPYDVGFASMQKTRVMGSWKLLPWFQRKAWESKQSVAEKPQTEKYKNLWE
jgi:hypothetical protein